MALRSPGLGDLPLGGGAFFLITRLFEPRLGGAWVIAPGFFLGGAGSRREVLVEKDEDADGRR